jgi:hypothetical protein
MSTTTEQIFIEALSLPVRSRAELVHKLLTSLEPELGTPEIEAAWAKEAIDRCKAYDEGQMTERDSADVLKDAYNKINKFTEFSAPPRLRG